MFNLIHLFPGRELMVNQRAISYPFLELFICLLLSCSAAAQIISKTTNVGPQVSIGSEGFDITTHNLWELGDDQYRSPLESPTGSLSKLDAKAPPKARHEFEKGYQLLMRKNLQGAVDHLTVAVTIYPGFVAAHNSLGSAYLSLNQDEKARGEFAQATALDDHLPSSYLNLACAQLALKQFPEAEESIRKASALAPLDIHMLTALAYGEFMNHNYEGTIQTADKIHAGRHIGSAKVHLYAAAAWQAQSNLAKAQDELQIFLKEDPKSPSAAHVLQMIQDLKNAPLQSAETTVEPAPPVTVTYSTVPGDAANGPGKLPENYRKLMQESKENAEIAEAEADAACPNCTDSTAARSDASRVGPHIAPAVRSKSVPTDAPYTMHSSTDEVAVFFAATDHGKSVTNLTGKDVAIRDDRRAPAAITGFLNESELPLRLGIVIDTSESITDRFKFEQESAINFVKKVVTGKSDLAFVVVVANSVLMVQDFTEDQDSLSHAINRLVPGGGTAIWDAVQFAADKLATRPESQPVARILVVLSDGEDNSSTATLKQAINRAQRGEVTIYAISTRVVVDDSIGNGLIAERALKTLAQLTGGVAFTPGSVHKLNGSLGDLQQVIRSRYLISYRPSEFKRDGQYRAIDIRAAKDGHKLRVYARKGYFASSDFGTPD